jgi:hypothetical protein
MKTKYLACLALFAFGCSGGQVTGGDDGDETQAELKRSAAQAMAQGTASGDVCVEHGWYGDGECDTFCADFDNQDCTPTTSGPPVACAAFIELSDGKCGRSADDPCKGQDPDCTATGQPDPTEPIACLAIAQVADGVCKPDPNDPCVALQDPDCNSIPPSAPVDPIACTAIAQVADGVCKTDPADPCLAFQDPDCKGDGGTGVICAQYVELADGVCKREPSDPCQFQDPDCQAGGGVACAEYIEVSDGVCKRDPNDPCIFQDPDCDAK